MNNRARLLCPPFAPIGLDLLVKATSLLSPHHRRGTITLCVEIMASWWTEDILSITKPRLRAWYLVPPRVQVTFPQLFLHVGYQFLKARSLFYHVPKYHNEGSELSGLRLQNSPGKISGLRWTGHNSPSCSTSPGQHQRWFQVTLHDRLPGRLFHTPSRFLLGVRLATRESPCRLSPYCPSLSFFFEVTDGY